MNLKESILNNTYEDSYKFNSDERDFEKFINCFKEDAGYFGKEKVVELYSMVYGEDLKEDLEGTINELDEANVVDWARENIDMSKMNSAKPSGFVPPKTPIDWKKLGAQMAKDVKVGANPKMAKIAQGSIDKGAMGFQFSALGRLWGKIKGFLGSSFTSIKNIISTGNWTALFKLPLFQGALAAGGIGALLLILKKIFGKKRIESKEEQIKEQAIKAGYKK